MEKLSKRVFEFLTKRGFNEDDINWFKSSSVNISYGICLYAHKNQFRDRNIPYSSHPINCLINYRSLVGIIENDPFCLDVDMLYSFDVPFDGVQEVCLLHDVIEDTDVTMDQIKDMFDEFGLKSHFILYIEPALKLLTHQKDVPYMDYIEKIMEHPIASIVKMMDLSNNLEVANLNSFDENNYNRAIKYLNCFKKINDKWHFLEKSVAYLISFKEEKLKRQN